MSGSGNEKPQPTEHEAEYKDAPYTWVSKTAEAPFRGTWWTIKNTSKWVANSVLGVLKGGYTATLGTVGGALYGAGKQIGKTAQEISSIVSESARKFDEAKNVGKIGPIISGILASTRKLVFGTVGGIPLEMTKQIISKPLEGGAEILSGINPVNAIRKGGKKTHTADSSGAYAKAA